MIPFQPMRKNLYLLTHFTNTLRQVLIGKEIRELHVSILLNFISPVWKINLFCLKNLNAERYHKLSLVNWISWLRFSFESLSTAINFKLCTLRMLIKIMFCLTFLRKWRLSNYSILKKMFEKSVNIQYLRWKYISLTIAINSLLQAG